MSWFKKAFNKVKKGVTKAVKTVGKVVKKTLPIVAPVVGTLVAPGLGTMIGGAIGKLAKGVSSSVKSTEIAEKASEIFGKEKVNELVDNTIRKGVTSITSPSTTANYKPTIYPPSYPTTELLTVKELNSKTGQTLGAGQGVYTEEAWNELHPKKSNNVFMIVILAVIGFFFMKKR